MDSAVLRRVVLGWVFKGGSRDEKGERSREGSSVQCGEQPCPAAGECIVRVEIGLNSRYGCIPPLRVIHRI